MLIRKIRLHPFAGTSDRIFTLGHGLQVLSGENEFGKSTLYNALQEVLFSNTIQTPGVLANWGNRWFPKPGGDYARVSLEFEAEGKIWILEKVWGAGHHSLLREEGGISLADPSAVGEKLRNLLKWNEATWTRVLFTRQSELARTIDELDGNLLGKIDDLETRLKGIMAIPGDVPAEQLKSLLDAAIKKQNSRWNTDLSQPEGGRGIKNPWSKEVGATLQAYYEMENAGEKLSMLREKESAIQAASELKVRFEIQGKEDSEFCSIGDQISAGLSSRAILEGRLTKLVQDEQLATSHFSAWPALIQEEISMREFIGLAEPEIQKLENELNISKKREKGKGSVDAYHQIVETERKLRQMEAELAGHPKPDAKLISEWEEVLAERGKNLMEVSALKLKISMLSQANVTLKIQEGLESEKNVSLEKNVKWEAEASGRFRLQYDGLLVTVENGELDLEGLSRNIRELEKKASDIQAVLGFQNPGDAKRVFRDWEEKNRIMLAQKELLRNLLRDRQKSEWDNWYAEYSQLPATREESFLDSEIRQKRREKDQKEALLKEKSDKLRELNSKYGDFQSLTGYILELKSQISEIRNTLSKLPELPAGYADISLYQQELSERKERHRSSEAQIRDLEKKILELSLSLPEESLNDLEADFHLKEKVFQRQKERGLSLLRIRQSLLDVLAGRQEADPKTILAESVSRRFHRLTHKAYSGVSMDQSHQALGKTSLPFSTLSRGTLGSLALALRLSLGDLYLQEKDGLLVLDDPFTEMDEARRAAAIREIGDFAQSHQVLLITCHEKHTAELLEAGGAEVRVE